MYRRIVLVVACSSQTHAGNGGCDTDGRLDIETFHPFVVIVAHTLGIEEASVDCTAAYRCAPKENNSVRLKIAKASP